MPTSPDRPADPIALIRQLDDYAYKATLLGSLDSDAGRRNALLKFGEAFKKASAALARLHAAHAEALALQDVFNRCADELETLRGQGVGDAETARTVGDNSIPVAVAMGKSDAMSDDAVRGRQASGTGRMTTDDDKTDGLLGSTVPEDPPR